MPSYTQFERFIKNINNDILSTLMKSQFLKAYHLEIVDCISGLPLFELTTTADVADSTVTLDILKETNEFLPLSECTFLADKGYDVKAIYNTVRDVDNGDCFIPLNKRDTKNPKKLGCGNVICEAGLANS